MMSSCREKRELLFYFFQNKNPPGKDVKLLYLQLLKYVQILFRQGGCYVSVDKDCDLNLF